METTTELAHPKPDALSLSAELAELTAAQQGQIFKVYPILDWVGFTIF